MEETIVLRLSKKQVTRLRNGHSVTVSRGGQRFLLDHKVKSSKANKIQLQIEKLRAKLKAIKKVEDRTHECKTCGKVFHSKKAYATHHVRKHVKNWSTNKPKEPKSQAAV